MDYTLSTEELSQEIDRLKSLLQTNEIELNTRDSKKERVKVHPNRKSKVTSNKARLFGIPKDMMGNIISNFSKTTKIFEIIMHKHQTKVSNQAISQNSGYDASIDEIIENFSRSLKEQEEILNLNKEKKPKASRVSARVTLSPKLLMNKVKKNFNKAKIVVMQQASILSVKYGDHKVNKAFEHDQKIADKLQNRVEKEERKQHKADFKAALKDEKKEKRKFKISRAKARVITMPFVLMNSVKKNFNKAKISVMNKVNNLSIMYNEYKENKAYERDQDLADDLQYEVEKARRKQRKADFKAALKEQSKIERKEKKAIRKQKVSSALSFVRSLPKNQLEKVKSGISRVSSAIPAKYGELYQELMDSKEEKQHIKNQKIADKLQNRVEKEEHKQHKADFKAAIKSEKKEERERRHQAILDMIKALDQEQQEELKAQQEKISSLQTEISYNMREGGGRRR